MLLAVFCESRSSLRYEESIRSGAEREDPWACHRSFVRLVKLSLSSATGFEAEKIISWLQTHAVMCPITLGARSPRVSEELETSYV
jgi:hypothetical protein